MHRILVVDDDERMRRGLCRVIASCLRGRDDVRMDQACRAEEARMLVEGTPNEAWFLVLDEEMPAQAGDLVKNGLALVRHLRTTPLINATVVMTGSVVTEAEAAAVGAIWLPKPFEMHLLKAQVGSWLPPRPTAP